MSSDDELFAQLTGTEDMESLGQHAVAKAYIESQISYIYYGIRVDELHRILNLNKAEGLAQAIRIGRNVIASAAEGCIAAGYDPLTATFLDE